MQTGTSFDARAMLQTLQNKSFPSATVGREIALDALSSPVVREGYGYWLAKRGPRAFPARADIRPAEIKRLLKNIILAKVIDEGRDYEFRIVGQAMEAAHGFNPTNARVSQLDSHGKGFTAMVMRVYGLVRETGRPYASRGTLAHVDRGYRAFESLFLPLGSDGGSVDRLFIIAGFSSDVDDVLGT